jgi:hypothetical protein
VWFLQEKGGIRRRYKNHTHTLGFIWVVASVFKKKTRLLGGRFYPVDNAHVIDQKNGWLSRYFGGA